MNFFDSFSGNWITKKSIFIHKYNIKHVYEEQIKIVKNDHLDSYNCNLNYNLNNKNINSYSFYLNLTHNLLNKKTETIINKYNIQKINHDLLKISINPKTNLVYHEYIYFINNNFNTSISFIKKNKNYLATIFTSYIKVYN